MNHIQLNKVQTYLQNNARPIDLALYNFYFHGGSAQKVRDELRNYQNDDGGFGNALEPDLRLPQSTALATWAAFRTMKEVGTPANNKMLQRGLNYLVSTYDQKRIGWAIIRPETDDYPHAPWWGYKTAMADFGWGNPSAELLGFLIKYGGSETASLVSALTQKALARIKEVEPSQFHEVLTFKGLYELAPQSLRKQLHEPLERLIQKAVSVEPDEWKEYTAPPLRFITSPADPFAYLFAEELVRKNLEFLADSIIDDHWEPNWDWSDTFADEWKKAKIEWSGQLTVNNMQLLRAFKVTNL